MYSSKEFTFVELCGEVTQIMRLESQLQRLQSDTGMPLRRTTPSEYNIDVNE